MNKKVPPVRIKGIRCFANTYPKDKNLTMEVPKMKFTQNQRILQVSEEKLIIGIDVASEIHYAQHSIIEELNKLRFFALAMT